MDIGRFIRLPPPAPMPGCMNMVPAPTRVRQPCRLLRPLN